MSDRAINLLSVLLVATGIALFLTQRAQDSVGISLVAGVMCGIGIIGYLETRP